MKTLPYKTHDRRRTTTALFAVLAAVSLMAAGCVQHAPRIRTVEPAVVPDPVNLVKEYNANIIEQSPDAAAGKFKKMSSDLFAFYRGTSDVFYRYNEHYGVDHALVPAAGAKVQLHGDYHLENFGAYKSEQGNISFDLLDFDDAFQGPYILDLRRMAVSIRIACGEKGYADRGDEMVMLFLENYARMLKEIESGETSANFYYRSGDPQRLVQKIVEAVNRVDRHQYLEKGCKTHIANNGKRVFNKDKGYVRIRNKAFLKRAIGRYLETVLSECRHDDAYYTIKDAVINRKGGIGSAAKLKYLVLIEGDTADQYDDVVLECKEERTPAWAEQYGAAADNNGRRVFMGFYLMQSETYPSIGYTTIEDKDFFVSEMTPYYRELETDDIKSPEDMKEMAVVAGRLIAKGHVRGAEDPKAAAGALAEAAGSDQFRRELLSFAQECYSYFQRGYEEFRERLKKYPLLMAPAAA